MDENAPVEPLERVRQLCLSYPEVSERQSHGEPTWFIREKKTFVMFSNHHHGGPLAFWCPAPPGAQEMLVDAAPDRFFRPPYVGHRGWLGVRLDIEVDWDEVERVVDDAFRTVAPRKLVELLDSLRRDRPD